jgi:hypothetical protein
LILSWVTANVAGQTKRFVLLLHAKHLHSNYGLLLYRAFAYACVNFAFYIGSILGPQTFQAKDAPQYLPAKTVILAAQSAAIVVAVIIRLYYGKQNSLREKRKSTEKIIKDMEWLNRECLLFMIGYTRLTNSLSVTDKENQTFRYEY